MGTYEANVEQDKVNVAAPDLPMYKLTLDRNLEMQMEGIVSRQTLDDAHKEYPAALTRRDSSQAQIGVDTAKLKQARAQVQQSQTTLHQREEQKSYTTILAPMDGVILSRDVEIGDAVSSIRVLGSTAALVMTEGDVNEMYVDGKVDEADIAHVYMGQPARIKVESFRDRTLNGKVTKISPMGVEKDNVTTFEVRVSIDNPGGELKALITANAEILLDEHKGVLTMLRRRYRNFPVSCSTPSMAENTLSAVPILAVIASCWSFSFFRASFAVFISGVRAVKAAVLACSMISFSLVNMSLSAWAASFSASTACGSKVDSVALLRMSSRLW